MEKSLIKTGLKAVARSALGDDQAQAAAAQELLAGIGKKVFGKLFRKNTEEEKLEKKFEKVLDERQSLFERVPKSDTKSSTFFQKAKDVIKNIKNNLLKMLMGILTGLKKIFGMIMTAIKLIATVVLSLVKWVGKVLIGGMLKGLQLLCRSGAFRKIKVRLKKFGRMIKGVPKGPAFAIASVAGLGIGAFFSSFLKSEGGKGTTEIPEPPEPKEDKPPPKPEEESDLMQLEPRPTEEGEPEKIPRQEPATLPPSAPAAPPSASASAAAPPQSQRVPPARAETGTPIPASTSPTTSAPRVGTPTSSAPTDGVSPLAANIAKYESGRGGYNAYNKGTVGNKTIGSDKSIDFSKMTIEEYFRRAKLSGDDPDRLFAVGKYQIIPITMDGAVKRMELDPKKTYLDPATQDLIYSQYLIGSKRPNVSAYLSGKSENINAAVLDLAMEFASIGVPYDIPNNNLQKGDSFYKGKGGNRAHNPPEQVAAALIQQRSVNVAKLETTTTVAQTGEMGQVISGTSLASAGQTQYDRDKNTRVNVIVASQTTNRRNNIEQRVS